ncbi:hypothetical protein Dimus_021036 [Dionaea muscipula]
MQKMEEKMANDTGHDHHQHDYYPTNEELVSFYLWRKAEKRPISTELIKQIDIYKHDPSDLIAKCSCNVGDKDGVVLTIAKEGGNIRTAFDQLSDHRFRILEGNRHRQASRLYTPMEELEAEETETDIIHEFIIELGSAGKGTKTDWMMHELPSSIINHPAP